MSRYEIRRNKKGWWYIFDDEQWRYSVYYLTKQAAELAIENDTIEWEDDER